MTMKEKIEMHAEIEAENKRKMEEWIWRMFWLQNVAADELRAIISTMDQGAEYDRMCSLLDKKLEMEKGGKTA